MIQQQNATVMSMGVSSSPPPSGYDNEDDNNDDDIGMTDEQVHVMYMLYIHVHVYIVFQFHWAMNKPTLPTHLVLYMYLCW